MQKKTDKNIKVFISDSSKEVEHLAKMLKKILLRAGMELLYLSDKNSNNFQIGAG